MFKPTWSITNHNSSVVHKRRKYFSLTAFTHFIFVCIHCHTFPRLQCQSVFSWWPSPGIWPSSAGQCACTSSGCRGNESIQDGGAVLSVSFICTIHAAFQDTNWHYWHILSPESVSRIISLPLVCTVVWHQTNHSQGTGYKSGPCGKRQ